MGQTWSSVLLVGTALTLGCGDSGPKAVRPVGGGNNGGNDNGSADSGADTGAGDASQPDSSVEDASTDGEAGQTFPDDKTGPEITIKQPVGVGGRAPIVGGVVNVIVSVKDDMSGVASETMVATLQKSATELVRIEPKASGSDFTFTFNAADYDARADLNMKVQVKDKAGNETTKSLLMQLDTVPPWVSLTPPHLRLVTKSGTITNCSGDFDPVGDDAPEDGEVVLQEARFRAFVWERGIEIPGATEIFLSGVDDSKVELFAQDDPKMPLLTDSASDPDKVCDAVNEGTARPVMLTPVKSAGSAPTGEGTESNEPDPAQCGGTLTKAKPSDTFKPLCIGSEMGYVPAHAVGSTVVYGVSTTASGLGCTGTSWDSETKGGWTCIVARAYDRAATSGKGNLGFSKPIRVCRKLKATDCEGAAKGDILTPPATLKCTDGCTLPEQVTDWGVSPCLIKN